MIEIVIYVKDLKIPDGTNLLNESSEDDLLELLDLVASPLNEDVKAQLVVKDKNKEVKIMIRDRSSYGQDGKLVPHGATIKVLDPKEKVGKGAPIRRDESTGKIVVDDDKVSKMKLSSIEIGKKVFEATEKRLNILWDKYNDDKKQEKLLKQITNDLLDAGIEVKEFTIKGRKEITDNLNNRIKNRSK